MLNLFNQLRSLSASKESSRRSYQDDVWLMLGCAAMVQGGSDILPSEGGLIRYELVAMVKFRLH